MLDRLSLAEGPIIVTSFGRIAFYVGILELAAVSAKAEVKGRVFCNNDRQTQQPSSQGTLLALEASLRHM